jgi:4-amino-4-deoxy-L-arabinose transferase-like glycosyltransferase
VILLVLLAVIWVVVLAPGALRRFGERQRVGSIDHFHHELQFLQHAGPKSIAPAYRLGGVRPNHSADPTLSRPRLVLLRPVDDGQSADIEDVAGAHYTRVGVIESPQPPTSPALTQAGLAAYQRQQARQRCTLVLRLLTAAATITGILGVAPSLRPAWIFTALTGITALALVGLIAHAREVEALRQRRLRSRPTYDDRPPSLNGPAQSGHPGAWDEEEDPPLRRAAGGR